MGGVLYATYALHISFQAKTRETEDIKHLMLQMFQHYYFYF